MNATCLPSPPPCPTPSSHSPSRCCCWLRWPSPAWPSSIPAWAAPAPPRRLCSAIWPSSPSPPLSLPWSARPLPAACPAARATPSISPASPGTGSAQVRFCSAAWAAAPAQSQLALLFEFLAVALAALIPWGSGADRWRLAAGCATAAVLAAFVFPLAAHWIWGGGWLAQLGVNFSLGAGFLDAGGAATVHVLGGLSAMAVIWIAGPRSGKFPKEGFSTAMPGHNAVYVLFGCLMSLVGWMAWNLAGAILWLNAPLAALPVTAINTLLSASAALAATFTVTRVRFGKPDASLCANGWMAGLVASSACAALVSPVAVALRRPRCRHRHAAAGRAVRTRPLRRRPLRRNLRPRRRRPLGTCSPPGSSPRARPVRRPAGRHRHSARRLSAPGLSALLAAQPRCSLQRGPRRRAHRHGPARAGRRRLSGVCDSPRRILPVRNQVTRQANSPCAKSHRASSIPLLSWGMDWRWQRRLAVYRRTSF